jgi:NodT family efflux transporter outer membrane factor (OMF) lipoprotein
MEGRSLGIPAVAALSLALAGCALAPLPTREEIAPQAAPNLRLPPGWRAPGAVGDAIAPDPWIAGFRDPGLEAYIAEVLANNPDLRVAAARVEVAAASVKAAGATLLPQVNLLAKGGGPTSGDGSGFEGGGIYATWEIDLWGRVRASQDAAALSHESAALDTEYARQSLAALAAKGWFLAIEARGQKAIAEDMVVASERLLSLARVRQRVGRGDEYDVHQAEANLQTFRDALAQVETAEKQSLRALEELAGRYPSAAIGVASGLPSMPGPVPVGLPSELLERRPDVVAAERRVAAAFRRVDEAQAARLPRISLTANVSSISSELFVLKNRDNPVWSAGAGLTAPIFLGGALQAQVEVRTAEQKAALADYGRIGARAFGEVEGALTSGYYLEGRNTVLERSVAENTRALELSEVRYRVGSTDLRSVQQQQIALASARASLLRVRTERLVQRVNLHLALGGGFPPSPAPATVSNPLSGT